MSVARYGWHLVRRFFGSLRPGGPDPVDEQWVASVLKPGELALWHAMAGFDRRHAVGVARRAEAALETDQRTPAVLAAALLHDVGKVEAGLGPVGRAAATVAALGVPRLRRGEPGWERRRGFVGRMGRYLHHPAIGSRLLRAAGSDPLTVAWAGEHHLRAQRWTVEATIAAALKAADDD